MYVKEGGFCERGNESSGFLQCGEFLDCLTQLQSNLPKTERDRSGIFFPFSQVSVLQRVVF